METRARLDWYFLYFFFSLKTTSKEDETQLTWRVFILHFEVSSADWREEDDERNVWKTDHY
jgi:hypothetical protein